VVIKDIIWKQEFVEKLARKHHVSIDEAEEALLKASVIRKIAKGHVNNEHVYASYSHIFNGRYLIVFFILKQGNRVLPVSARDMDLSERKYYENQKKKH